MQVKKNRMQIVAVVIDGLGQNPAQMCVLLGMTAYKSQHSQRVAKQEVDAWFSCGSCRLTNLSDSVKVERP